MPPAGAAAPGRAVNLSEILWTIAFCSFLLGGAWSFRSNGAWPAIGLMAFGALLDAAVALLPQLGVEALSYHMTKMNTVFAVSMTAGIVVYALFISAVVLRWRGRLAAFHWCIALAQPVWFLSFIGFLYGLYIVPDAIMR
jgi:hypothetical protein